MNIIQNIFSFFTTGETGPSQQGPAVAARRRQNENARPGETATAGTPFNYAESGVGQSLDVQLFDQVGLHDFALAMTTSVVMRQEKSIMQDA
jgi:hypothetical protein